jgi:hypothetical protein
MKTALHFALASLLLASCGNHPFDDFRNIEPQDWAPFDFLIEDISITERRLNWSYRDHNIQGFKIDRKKGDEPWQEDYAELPPKVRSWIDREIVPDPSLEYSYRVYAYAGWFRSAEQTATIIAAIPRPAKLRIVVNSTGSVTLSWQDNSIGEEGFRIDRKSGDDDWQTEFAEIPANQTSFTDNNVNLDGTIYSYRIYAFAGAYYSTFSQKQTPFPCGVDVTFIYNGNSVTYGTAEGANGTCWMDRNLGASRVATEHDDMEAWGDLFQWGRGDDGHQIRTSGTTSVLSKKDNPGHGNFIMAFPSPWDWRSPQNDSLWQGDGGINDVCPVGWRIPTLTELANERLSWSSNDSAGAFASPLKLVVGGFRRTDGSLGDRGFLGAYWSSSGRDVSLNFYSLDAYNGANPRGRGLSVRCIRDD